MSQRLERLDDESAFREFEAGLFQGSVIENKNGASDLVRAVRAIRQINCTCGYLRGETEQVLGDGSARLNPPAEFACERLCHLVEVGAQFRREHFTELGIPRITRRIEPLRSNRWSAESTVGRVPRSAKSRAENAQPFLLPWILRRACSSVDRSVTGGAILQEKIPLFSCKSKGRYPPAPALERLSTAPLSSPSVRLLESITCAPERLFHSEFCGEPTTL